MLLSQQTTQYLLDLYDVARDKRAIAAELESRGFNPAERGRVFTIWASRLDEVLAALKKSNRKGGDMIEVLEIGDVYEQTTVTELLFEGEVANRHERQVKVLDIRLRGDYKPSEDYVLVAKLEKDTDKSNIVLSLGTDPVPAEYRCYNDKCDHCKKRRNRVNQYLVKRLATGEFLQIGEQCLADFFPKSANEIIKLALFCDYFSCVMSDGDYMGGGGGYDSYDPMLVLKLAYACTKRYGYVKREDQTDTKPSTLNEVLYCIDKGITVDPDTNIAPMLEWLDAQPDKSDYIYNVKALVKQFDVSSKRLGFLVSLPAVFLREVEKRNAGEQTLVDVSAGRFPVTGVVKSFKEYDSDFGTVYKMLVRCEGFNVFGTIPKDILDCQLGDTVSFTATFEPKETGFAIYSRPTKATIVKTAEV